MIEIPLRSRTYPGLVTLVDQAKVELVAGYGWFPQRNRHTFYAAANTTKADGQPTLVLMHRLIAGAAPGQKVDHADRDGLNNTLANLRFGTDSQHNANRDKWQRNGIVKVPGGLLGQEPVSLASAGPEGRSRRHGWQVRRRDRGCESVRPFSGEAARRVRCGQLPHIKKERPVARQPGTLSSNKGSNNVFEQFTSDDRVRDVRAWQHARRRAGHIGRR
jgi:hypothetical protein